MKNDVDDQLKQRILSEPEPALPQGFADQTAGQLMHAVHTQAVFAQGRSPLAGRSPRVNWGMALVLTLVLSVAWKWGVDKLTEDDELMRVDTLSMSSLLVL